MYKNMYVRKIITTTKITKITFNCSSIFIAIKYIHIHIPCNLCKTQNLFILLFINTKHFYQINIYIYIYTEMITIRGNWPKN